MDTLVPGADAAPTACSSNSSARVDYALHPAHRDDGRLLQRRLRASAAAGRAARRLARRTPTRAAWTGRADRSDRRRVRPAFWDRVGGAFRDTTDGPGRASRGRERLRGPRRARDADPGALGARLPQRRTTWQPYGATIADNDVWDGSALGRPRRPARLPVHLLLRAARAVPDGLDRSALDADPPRVGLHARRTGRGRRCGRRSAPTARRRSTRSRPTTTAGRAAPRRR